MAEEVKKSRPAPDPNSAKYKLGQIAAKAYSDAMEAKKRGEMVGWCSSNFPVEIPATLGLYVCYPENQAAGIAARGGGERLCSVSEGDGYSNDICAYARISLAYAKLKEAPEQDMPMPDFLLCCNNICNCMIKWYENISKELGIPMIMIDIPFNPDYEVSDAETEYIKAQFWDAIRQLEENMAEQEKCRDETDYSGRFPRIDSAFHKIMIDSVGRYALVNMLNDLMYHVQRWRNFDVAFGNRISELIREHWAIVNAIKAEDLILAQQSMANHLETITSIAGYAVAKYPSYFIA